MCICEPSHGCQRWWREIYRSKSADRCLKLKILVQIRVQHDRKPLNNKNEEFWMCGHKTENLVNKFLKKLFTNNFILFRSENFKALSSIAYKYFNYWWCVFVWHPWFTYCWLAVSLLTFCCSFCWQSARKQIFRFAYAIKICGKFFIAMILIP